MTYIRPAAKQYLSRAAFVIGGILIALEMGTVVYLYNGTVNLTAAIEYAKDAEQTIASQNAVMQNRLVASLDGSLLSKSPYDELVEDAHPEYMNSQISKR